MRGVEAAPFQVSVNTTWSNLASVPALAISDGIEIVSGAKLTINSNLNLTLGSSASIEITDGTFEIAGTVVLSMSNGMNLTLKKGTINFISGTFNLGQNALIELQTHSSIHNTMNVNNFIIKFGQGSKMSMFANTRLFLNSGSLLELNGTAGTGYWKGIYADNSATSQFATYPTDIVGDPIAWNGVLSDDVTRIILSNGSKIQDAEKGISADNGSVVQARGATFLNCRAGIEIMNWHESSPKERFNASFIMSSSFKWNWTTDVTAFESKNALKHVFLYDIGGVKIGGCEFINDSKQPGVFDCVGKRGVGIELWYSEAIISKDGDRGTMDILIDENGCPENTFLNNNPLPKGNTFKNLGLGINFIGEEVLYKNKVIIKHNTFQDNWRSISVQHSMDLAVGHNTFSIDNVNFNSKFRVVGSYLVIGGQTTTHFAGDMDIAGCQIIQEKISFFYGDDIVGLRFYENHTSSDRDNIFHIQLEDNFVRGYKGPIRNESLIKGNNFNDFYEAFTCPETRHAINIRTEFFELDIVCNYFDGFTSDIFLQGQGNIKRIPLRGTKASMNRLSTQIGSFPCEGNILTSQIVKRIEYYYKITSPVQIDANNRPFPENPYIDYWGIIIPVYAFKVAPPEQNFCNVLCADLLLKVPKTENITAKVYPNPAGEKISVNLLIHGIENNIQYQIMDFTGRFYFRGEMHNGENQLNIERIPNGLYYIQITNGLSNTLIKFIKN